MALFSDKFQQLLESPLHCSVNIDMSDNSDSDTPLERVDSGPKMYDIVPVATDYHICLVAVKKKKLLYTLKAGQSLPYDFSLKGTFKYFHRFHNVLKFIFFT